MCGVTCCFFLGWEPLVLLGAFVGILVLVGRSGWSGSCELGRSLVAGGCHCRQIRWIRPSSDSQEQPGPMAAGFGCKIKQSEGSRWARRGQSMVSRIPREKLIGPNHRFFTCTASQVCRFPGSSQAFACALLGDLTTVPLFQLGLNRVSTQQHHLARLSRNSLGSWSLHQARGTARVFSECSHNRG